MQNQFPELLIQFIVTTVIGLILVGFIILIVRLYNQKKKNQQAEIIQLRSAFEKELLQTQLEIQEEVLQRIAMDIHDNVGQELLLVNINLSMLQPLVGNDDGKELVKETKKLVSEIMEDVSQLSRSMHTGRITSMGVIKAIETELLQLERKNVFEIVMDFPEDFTGASMSVDAQLLLFRMYQEIIKNILKHAGASLVQCTVQTKSDGVLFFMKDNGKGFDRTVFEQSDIKEAQIVSSGGVGMHSLKSRAALMKATIEIKSAIGKGTEICIFIPGNY
jgi:signal transduction histidine kinase